MILVFLNWYGVPYWVISQIVRLRATTPNNSLHNFTYQLHLTPKHLYTPVYQLKPPNSNHETKKYMTEQSTMPPALKGIPPIHFGPFVVTTQVLSLT